jgi:hypothetical protein
MIKHHGDLKLAMENSKAFQSVVGTWAPRKCKCFMWLVAHGRCWTADRLARQGLSHPEHCPLCEQEEETISHLLSPLGMCVCPAVLAPDIELLWVSGCHASTKQC